MSRGRSSTFDDLKLAPILLALVTLCSTLAIVATYTRLSHTWDEGTHVSAGLEVLQDGRYTSQTENPPLSRIVLAIVPYLNGARFAPPEPGRNGAFAAAAIFDRSPSAVRNVTEGRVANLFFFWACVALTWVLAGGRRDPWVAFVAAGAVATLPPIVAHAGLATTDVAFVAVFLAVLVALRACLIAPTIKSAVALGAALGIAVATKFSTLAFLPPVVAALLVMRAWPERRRWASWLRSLRAWSVWRLALTGALVAFVVVWASYGFRIGRLSDLPTKFAAYGEMPTTGWVAAVKDWRLPAHELVHGLLYLKAHALKGHNSLLLGEYSTRGFPLYYPVVLATKTPAPFLLFAAAGFFGLVQRGARAHPEWRWFAGLALGSVALVFVAMMSTINIGVRHVIVVYPLVAIAAAFGFVRWAEGRPWRARALLLAIGVTFVAVELVLLVAIVPNQLTYFNVLAGREPAHVSSDSDFDWGQDGVALERYLADHHVPELYVQLQGTVNPCKMQLPPFKALPVGRVTGWIAISERVYRLNRVGRSDPCLGTPLGPPVGWLDWLHGREPVAIIGKTIRLYHVPDDSPPAWAFVLNPPGAASGAAPPDDGELRHVPDSTVRLSLAETRNLFFAPDWHPEDHPAMPAIVARGRTPTLFACGYCHRADGSGGPENASLAGLSVEYMVQQVADMKNGARRTSVPERVPSVNMMKVAMEVSAADVESAAAYFHALAPRANIAVTEVDFVPETIATSWHLVETKSGRTERIGTRILEVPVDAEQFENRDARARFVAYVPRGSIARGRSLATDPKAGKTLPCVACHGADLRGVGNVPALAGRSPSYVVRQLYDFKHGARASPAGAPMLPVVKELDLEDMIALAAYVASVN